VHGIPVLAPHPTRLSLRLPILGFLSATTGCSGGPITVTTIDLRPEWQCGYKVLANLRFPFFQESDPASEII